ncbi:acyl carrier protein [Streptomyces sp. ISL-11]|nr:acyl carrier protein [Streptomyces sp. ISL-11]
MPSDTTATPDPTLISASVKRVLITESRISVTPDAVPDDEPLNGGLLKVSSLGFLGMLIRLEDDLGVELPDDLFVGRTFHTVRDIIDLVTTAAEGDA